MRSELRDVKRLLEPLKPRFVDQALGAEAVEAIWQLRGNSPIHCAIPVS